MRKKIVGIFVCMLLISTVLPATGTFNEKIMTSTGGNESIPILNFINITGGLLGFSVELFNFGEIEAKNINWSMDITEGTFLIFNITLFYPRSDRGVIDLLLPGEGEKIVIKPVVGLGRATVTFYYNYTIELTTSRTEGSVGGIEEWRDQCYGIVHTFPEGAQPTKEWVDVHNYVYFMDEWVRLFYNISPGHGILQKHAVRCINISNDQEEFYSTCSFFNGEGEVWEGNRTKYYVQNEIWKWQVELINGE